MRSRLVLFLVAAATCCACISAQQSEVETDLFALELVQFDLQQAKRMMVIYDRDQDGTIDKDEQNRLRWKDDVATFDLNKDGKLTHLEMAIREAKQRHDSDITQFDVNNVNTFLRRYDKNNNGQLDPDEIANGWPSNPDDYDASGDGIITAKEMQQRFAFNRFMRREMGIEGVDQTAAMRLIRRFDQDNDKKLDEEERAGAPLPRPAKDFDEDDDGRLGIMEVSTMLARHRRESGLTIPDQKKVNRLIQQVDMNGDGTITQEELDTSFGGSLKQAYAEYDRDSDGVITVSEVEKVVAASREEKGYIEEDFQKAVIMLRRHDENRSKYIEASELFDSPKPGQLPKSLLEQADRDKDQRVGLDELARHFAAQRKRKE